MLEQFPKFTLLQNLRLNFGHNLFKLLEVQIFLNVQALCQQLNHLPFIFLSLRKRKQAKLVHAVTVEESSHLVFAILNLQQVKLHENSVHQHLVSSLV